jgi:hypothetical protein
LEGRVQTWRDEGRRGRTVKHGKEPGTFLNAPCNDFDRLARQRGGSYQDENVGSFENASVGILAVSSDDI